MSDNPASNKTTGRDAFLAIMRDEGVRKMFGNPGTTELPIMHALTSQEEIGYVLGLQESVVIAMADGYARASDELVSCNVHVAPGLGNAIGAIYTANRSNTPMIVTAGQQELGHGLNEPLLYAPLVPIAEPVVKWATEVSTIEELPIVLRRAAKIATTAPTGPVFISLPGDILNNEDAIDLGEVTRVDTKVRPTKSALEAFAKRVLEAKNPVIIAGTEIVTSDAFDAASAFADALGAPVWQQTVQHGAHFPSEHPLFMGSLSRDQPHVRQTLDGHDLLICLGSEVLQMSVYHPVSPLPDGAKIVQIGERDWEMGKSFAAEIALRADLRETLLELTPELQRQGGDALAKAASSRKAELNASNWSAKKSTRAENVAKLRDHGPMEPDWVMLRLSEMLPDNATIMDEGLTSARALPAFFPFRDRYAYFGNVTGGIGWGIAASVGIQMARPERRVVAVIGDGSSMYSIQALWSAAHYKLPVTFLILNNGGYRILKQRLKAYHGNDKPIGMDFRDPPIDISKIAEGYGLVSHRVEDANGFEAAFEDAMARTDGPTLIEAMVAGPV